MGKASSLRHHVVLFTSLFSVTFCRFLEAPSFGDFPCPPYNVQSLITFRLPLLVYRYGGVLDIPGPENSYSFK